VRCPHGWDENGQLDPSLEQLSHFTVRNKHYESSQGSLWQKMVDVEGNEMLREYGKNCSFAKKSEVLKGLNPCMECLDDKIKITSKIKRQSHLLKSKTLC
jgi:hypothetical protein